MKTALQTLEEAWALLQKPGVWIQRNYALNSFGASVDPRQETACYFCSVGAIYRQTGWGNSEAQGYLRQAAEELHNEPPQRVNDSAKSVQDLAPMWERAIELARIGLPANDTRKSI